MVKEYGVSPIDSILRHLEVLRKADALMTAIRMRPLSQYSGSELYQATKEDVDGQA